MLQKFFNREWQITSKSFLLSSFLIGFSFPPTAEISSLELEFEQSLPRKTASIFKEGIGQESNGVANQEKHIFLLCQISPSASSTRDLGMRLRVSTPKFVARNIAAVECRPTSATLHATNFFVYPPSAAFRAIV